MREYLTIGQTAKRLGLEVDTVRKLERTGKIKAARTTGGHRRFTFEEVERYHRNAKARASMSARPSGMQQQRPRKFRPIADESSLSDAELGLVLDDEDLEDFGWEADEMDPPHPTPLRGVPPTPTPYVPRSASDTGAADKARLQNIKRQGRNAVPWGIPTEWQGRIIAELERFVTPTQFPSYLSAADATDLVTARVEEVLRSYREEVAKAGRDRQAAELKALQDLAAAEQVKQLRSALISHGAQYARQETSDWDISPAYEARAEVGRILDRDVKHDSTKVEVESLIDDVLDQWDDDDDE